MSIYGEKGKSLPYLTTKLYTLLYQKHLQTTTRLLPKINGFIFERIENTVRKGEGVDLPLSDSKDTNIVCFYSFFGIC